MAVLSSRGRSSRSAVSLSLAVACAVAGLSQTPREPAPAADEYRVKAAFLRSFAKFVEWPERRSEGARRKLLIGVLGENPFGRAIEEQMEGEFAGGAAIEIVTGRSLEQVKRCHVLFISSSERLRIQQHLDLLAHLPVLTVSDSEGFARQGGMIELRLERKRIRFAINPAAVERAGLRMSSRLLSLAVIVGGEPREGAR